MGALGMTAKTLCFIGTLACTSIVTVAVAEPFLKDDPRPPAIRVATFDPHSEARQLADEVGNSLPEIDTAAYKAPSLDDPALNSTFEQRVGPLMERIKEVFGKLTQTDREIFMREYYSHMATRLAQHLGQLQRKISRESNGRKKDQLMALARFWEQMHRKVQDLASELRGR